MGKVPMGYDTGFLGNPEEIELSAEIIQDTRNSTEKRYNHPTVEARYNEGIGHAAVGGAVVGNRHSDHDNHRHNKRRNSSDHNPADKSNDQPEGGGRGVIRDVDSGLDVHASQTADAYFVGLNVKVPARFKHVENRFVFHTPIIPQNGRK